MFFEVCMHQRITFFINPMTVTLLLKFFYDRRWYKWSNYFQNFVTETFPTDAACCSVATLPMVRRRTGFLSLMKRSLWSLISCAGMVCIWIERRMGSERTYKKCLRKNITTTTRQDIMRQLILVWIFMNWIMTNAMNF